MHSCLLARFRNLQKWHHQPLSFSWDFPLIFRVNIMDVKAVFFFYFSFSPPVPPRLNCAWTSSRLCWKIGELPSKVLHVCYSEAQRPLHTHVHSSARFLLCPSPTVWFLRTGNPTTQRHSRTPHYQMYSNRKSPQPQFQNGSLNSWCFPSLHPQGGRWGLIQSRSRRVLSQLLKELHSPNGSLLLPDLPYFGPLQ